MFKTTVDCIFEIENSLPITSNRYNTCGEGYQAWKATSYCGITAKGKIALVKCDSMQEYAHICAYAKRYMAKGASLEAAFKASKALWQTRYVRFHEVFDTKLRILREGGMSENHCSNSWFFEQQA